MPTVRCPRCNVRLRAAESMLDRAILCPVCGSGLWRPSWHDEPPVQTSPVPPSVVFLDAESDRSPGYLIAGISVAVLMFAGIVVLVVKGSGSEATPVRPSETARRAPDSQPSQSEPMKPQAELPPTVRTPVVNDDWTMDRLLAHLEHSGVQFTARDRAQSTNPGVWLTDGANSTAMIIQHKSAADAALAASRTPDPGESQFSWGRFVISGRGPLFQRVRSALTSS